MTYKYILDRGMTEVTNGGYETPEEAERAGRQHAKDLNTLGLDTTFVKVEEE